MVGAFEVVVHRCIWTALILLLTTSIFKKWDIFKFKQGLEKNKKIKKNNISNLFINFTL